MKLIINYSGANIISLMRKVGYFSLGERDFEISFIRPLDRFGYPRFHIYIKINKEKREISLNLHLDQKRPVYKGVSAHSGEYDGPLVEQELERVKNILKD